MKRRKHSQFINNGAGTKNFCPVELEAGRNHQLHIRSETRAADVGKLRIKTELFPEEGFCRCAVAVYRYLRVYLEGMQHPKQHKDTQEDALYWARQQMTLIHRINSISHNLTPNFW